MRPLSPISHCVLIVPVVVGLLLALRPLVTWSSPAGALLPQIYLPIIANPPPLPTLTPTITPTPTNTPIPATPAPSATATPAPIYYVKDIVACPSLGNSVLTYAVLVNNSDLTVDPVLTTSFYDASGRLVGGGQSYNTNDMAPHSIAAGWSIDQVGSGWTSVSGSMGANSSGVAAVVLPVSNLNGGPTGGSWVVQGTITNNTNSTVTAVAAHVFFYDSAGRLGAANWQYASSETLAPGATALFSVSADPDCQINAIANYQVTAQAWIQ